ncbi:hypothetical protein BDV98DRAFT_586997 [Pterulicium gracile]|uniref:Ser-Thr-rich glycosyl-phosphatidyl-inositol-anchored membrane family-domain-containing protein n=1 Tax=Pterulicium gracile TaxID=1884261 RepID=A0A5C3Q097_9AGAR|nr:hypothetical protein BDV98DRAFT_586997 [Pterula gracilis]
MMFLPSFCVFATLALLFATSAEFASLEASPAPSLTTVTLHELFPEPTVIPVTPPGSFFDESFEVLGTNEAGWTTYEYKYGYELVVSTGDPNTSTSGQTDGFETVLPTTSVTYTWVVGDSGRAVDNAGTHLASCVFTIGGQGHCEDAASLEARQSFQPLAPESGDVRILREGDGEDSEEEDTGGNDDGGERAEGAARAVWISAGLAAAATLFSGSALLFL